jgi:hypothetical protein
LESFESSALFELCLDMGVSLFEESGFVPGQRLAALSLFQKFPEFSGATFANLGIVNSFSLHVIALL